MDDYSAGTARSVVLADKFLHGCVEFSGRFDVAGMAAIDAHHFQAGNVGLGIFAVRDEALLLLAGNQ